MDPTDNRQLILVTTVDIGGGMTDLIELYLGDEPEDAAAAFCKKNGLPECVVQPLADHIRENYERAQHEDFSEGQNGAADEDQQQASQQSKGSFQCSAARSSQSEGALERLRGELRSCSRSVSSDGALPERRERLEMEARWRGQQQAEAADTASDGFLTAIEYRSAKSGPPSSSGGPYLYEPAEPRGGRRSAAGGLTPRPGSAASLGHSVHSAHDVAVGRPLRAYDRLYENAKEIALRQERRRQARDAEIEERMRTARKGMNYVSAELMRARDAAGYSSYCERLYIEGLEELEKKKRLMEVRKEEAAAAELEEVTWAPHISRMARHLRRPDSDTELWSRLAKPAVHKNKERIEEMKREIEEEAEKECTFAPIIDKRSHKMMSQRALVLKERHISAHEQLYQDAERRLQRRAQYEAALPEAYTFAPRILKRAPDSCKVLRDGAAADGRRRGSRGADADLAERLYERREMAEAKKRAAQAAVDNPVDPATGRPLFRPAINSSAAHLGRRNTHGLPVGHHLYNYWTEYEGRKAALAASLEAEREAAATAVKTSSRSGRLMQRLRAKRFHQIFAYLDQEGAGALDLLALVALDEAGLMRTLDAEVAADVEAAAKTLARRLQHRSELDAGAAAADDCMTPPPNGQGPGSDGNAASDALLLVDAERFAHLMEEVVQRGRGPPRAYLLPSPVADKRRDPDEATFQPSVCSHSKELVARRRAAMAQDEPVFEELYREASTFKERAQRRQAAFQEELLKGCTFQPEQLSARKAARGRALAMSGLRSDGSPDASSPASAATPDPDLHKYQELEREVRAALAAAYPLTLCVPPTLDPPGATASEVSATAEVALRSSATSESLAALQSLAVAGAVVG